MSVPEQLDRLRACVRNVLSHHPATIGNTPPAKAGLRDTTAAAENLVECVHNLLCAKMYPGLVFWHFIVNLQRLDSNVRFRFATKVVYYISTMLPGLCDHGKGKVFIRKCLNEGSLLACLEASQLPELELTRAFYTDDGLLREGPNWESFVKLIAPIGGVPLDARDDSLVDQPTAVTFELEIHLPQDTIAPQVNAPERREKIAVVRDRKTKTKTVIVKRTLRASNKSVTSPTLSPARSPRAGGTAPGEISDSDDGSVTNVSRAAPVASPSFSVPPASSYRYAAYDYSPLREPFVMPQIEFPAAEPSAEDIALEVELQDLLKQNEMLKRQRHGLDAARRAEQLHALVVQSKYVLLEALREVEVVERMELATLDAPAL